ncbi:MAG: VTT domain-containing protein [Anaerolineae bacterium]|nr:VTT domain-containing protein [Anaerolineae bacterium]
MLNNATFRWIVLWTIILAIILVPFILFGAQIEGWTEHFLDTTADKPGWVSLVLGSLLALDVFLPVPSSMASTAAGFILGFLRGGITSLLGMTVSCLAGFWVGNHFGRPVAQKLVGSKELERMEELGRRFGDWVIVVSRPVPVLAEASVLFAGMSRMPLRRYVLLSLLSNLAISAVYAAVGAYSATVDSFLLAFGGSILVPLAAMVVMRKRESE